MRILSVISWCAFQSAWNQSFASQRSGTSLEAKGRMESIGLELGRKEGARRLAVIGKEVKEGLFPPSIDPIGQQIRLNGVTFEVIGTLPEKGGSSMFSRDNIVVVPLATAMRRLFGTDLISSMTVWEVQGMRPRDWANLRMPWKIFSMAPISEVGFHCS